MIYVNINKWIFVICIALFILNVQAKKIVPNKTELYRKNDSILLVDDCVINTGNFNGSTKIIINEVNFKFVTFSCEENYTLIGKSNALVCQNENFIDIKDRFCKLTTTFNCPPFKYKNANVTFYNDGDRALLFCKFGYYYNKPNESPQYFEVNCINKNWTGGNSHSCKLL
ncbi:uncharacterized protein LOC127291220 isoform X2 [Leptopilina boulardi]|uniref:uncharacterized protein LOC127286786 isoform X2 n=1 Tax=Leptopilina boulardi TaxID=63433 RepID=UPI0021F6954B|nr:uncharacterized protein LOC127286786 isoform X2 [Leptopilina boulardi]XP_051176157.1 uncharacterized protein LOC127291220 isoform X2 [Leptopilina boulardi]